MQHTPPMPSDHPPHIVLVGPMGAGKSSIGRLLAAQLGYAFIDLDACIETQAGMTITALFASEGEAAFRQRESSMLATMLGMPATSILATGGGAVLDDGNRRAMGAAGTVVYLQVEPAIQNQRLQGDTTRPLLATADPAQRLVALQTQREPLYRDVADLIFDTTPHSPQSAADALVILLAQATERCA